MESLIIIYTTIESKDEALKIARLLVEERLVACGNIIPQVISVYSWQDKLEQAEEVILLLKTRNELKTKVINRIKDVHSYECPAIIALSPTDQYPDFLSWVISKTS